MEKLRLYRGITVSEKEADSIIEDIKSNGLDHNTNQIWGSFVWKNLKNNLDILYQKEVLTRDDTESASIWVKTKNGGHREYIEGDKSICFADKQGAKYYATKQNVTEELTVPLLITVDLELDNIAIDGRDFLYTVFGFIDPNDSTKTKRQAEKLKLLFGYKMEKYIEKIIKHPKSDRFAICDLAINDNEIIIEHSKNQKVIGGRYNTIFKSAFFGKVPIKPNSIIDIERITNVSDINHPDITLNDILER
jgi:hypothetical protein